MNTAPVLGSQNDLLAVQNGRLVSFDLQANQVRYELTSQFTGAVTVANDLLYLTNGGQLQVRREADGSQVWSWTPPQGNLVGTTIVTQNIVLASTDAATYAIDLASHRQVWSFAPGGRLSLSGQGVLAIARSDGNLSVISIR